MGRKKPQMFTNTEQTVEWGLLKDEHIYGSIHNFGVKTKFSTMVDALIKSGCSTFQIHLFFQNLGINVYEDHIELYKKYGITYKEGE